MSEREKLEELPQAILELRKTLKGLETKLGQLDLEFSNYVKSTTKELKDIKSTVMMVDLKVTQVMKGIRLQSADDTATNMDDSKEAMERLISEMNEEHKRKEAGLNEKMRVFEEKMVVFEENCRRISDDALNDELRKLVNIELNERLSKRREDKDTQVSDAVGSLDEENVRYRVIRDEMKREMDSLREELRSLVAASAAAERQLVSCSCGLCNYFNNLATALSNGCYDTHPDENPDSDPPPANLTMSDSYFSFCFCIILLAIAFAVGTSLIYV